MSRTRVAGIAAAMLAVGLAVGMASTVIAHDGRTTADCTGVVGDHMNDQAMADHMNGAAMGDMGSMMGGGSMIGPGGMDPNTMGPAASGMPGNRHQLHHPQATSGATR